MKITRIIMFLSIVLIAGAVAGEEQEYNFIRALFDDKAYTLVIQEANRFLGENPASKHTADVLFLKGESEFKLKDFNGATLTFTKFIKRFPRSKYHDDARLRTGQAFFYLANYDSAIVILELIPEGPLFYDGWYLIGECFYKKGNYQAAAYYYQAILDSSKKKEHRPLAIYSLGFCYQNLKDYQRAIIMFDSLINNFSTHALALDASLAKGNCLVGQGKMAEAVSYLENVSEQDERIAAQAKLLIADIDLEQAQYEKARIQYERIQRYYPESEFIDDAQFGIGLSYFLEEAYIRAVDAFNVFLKNFSQSNLINKTRYYLGLTWARRNDYSQARKFFELVEGNMKMQARYQYALTYYNENNYAACERAVGDELKKPLPEALRNDYHILLAESYYRAGDAARAVNQFLLVKKADVYFRAANISFKLNDFQKAISILNEITGEVPDSLAAEVSFYKAESYYNLNRYDEALVNYQLVIERYAESRRRPEAYYGSGWIYFLKGLYIDAIKYFKKLYDEFPENRLVAEVLIKIGDCYFNIKNNEEAINYYLMAAKKYPSTPYLNLSYLKIGNALYRLNRFEEAKNYYNKAKSDTGLVDQAYYLAGFSLFRKGNYEGALKEFAKVKESSLQYWSAQYAAADAYYNLGKYEEAKLVYRDIIARGEAGLFLPAVDGLAWSYEKLGQPDGAIKELEELINKIADGAKKPNLLLKRANLLYNKQRFTDAAIEYGRVINGYPNTTQAAEAIYWSGWTWYRLKDYGKARQYFKDLINQFPGDQFYDEANFLIGKISYEMKEYKTAIEHLTRLKVESKKAYQDLVYFYLGRAHLETGESTKAIDFWLAAFKEYPESDGGTRSALELGKTRLKDMNYDEALSYFKEVILKREDEVAAEAQYQIGELNFAKKDLKNAALEYMRLSYVYGKFTDWSLRGQLKAAIVHKDMGEIDQAKNLLAKIIKNHPDSPQAQEARDLLSTLSR